MINYLKKSYLILKLNPILLLPPIIAFLITGIVLMAGGTISFIILIFWRKFTSGILFLTLILVFTFFSLLVGVIWIANLAGWMNMYKTSLEKEKTSFSDYKNGIKEYFLRTLGGSLLRIFISGSFAIFFFYFISKTILQIDLIFYFFYILKTPKIAFQEINQLLKNITPSQSLCILGVISFWAILEVIISFLFFFWKQALFLDNLGVLSSYEKSIDFVLKNFIFVFISILIQIGVFIVVGIFFALLTLIITLPFKLLGGEKIFIDMLSFPINLLQQILLYIISIFFTIFYFIIYKERTNVSSIISPSETSEEV